MWEDCLRNSYNITLHHKKSSVEFDLLIGVKNSFENWEKKSTPQVFSGFHLHQQQSKKLDYFKFKENLQKYLFFGMVFVKWCARQ